MHYNNGTIFRIYIATTATEIINGVFNAKVNINQQLLNGKVYIGVENLVLTANLSTDEKKDYWASMPLIQLSSINLPPYIDFSSVPEIFGTTGNTPNFCRFPLVILPTIENTANVSETRFGFNNVFNKDSILYEMLNNQNALANGNLNIKILDVYGNVIPDNYISDLAFTIVIYKPNNKYN
jgi:hypothetical protein